MSHVTCHDVLLARKCLMVVTFILGFAFWVRIHVSGSHLQFVIQLDMA